MQMTGPVSSSGFSGGALAPNTQAYVVLGAFAGAFVLLFILGRFGAALDASISVG